MASNITFNGVTYSIPAVGDDGWGSDLSAYFIAIASGALQKTGGNFTLTAEANFGATFGLKSAYLKSQATNPASAGIVRLGNNESISWRNNANNADINLKVNASDSLEFNGASILYGLILNANVDPAAAIALSKLATVTASRVLVSDVSGIITASAITTTTLAFLDATSSIQTQLDAKASSASLTSHTGATTSVHGIANTADLNLKSTLTTKGDLYVATASATVTRQGVGTDGQVLTADSAQANGVTWASPASSPTSSYEISNLGLAVSVGSGALTIALKQADGSTNPSSGSGAVKVGMRSSTLTSGLYNQRSVTSALSLVVSSGSTLGQTSARAARIYFYLIDNAGTLELAVSQKLFPETQLISTTAEGGAGAADSGTVMYSATARSNVPFRVIGFLDNTQTTAGTWASAGTKLQVGDYAFVNSESPKLVVSGSTTTAAGAATNVSWLNTDIDTHGGFASNEYTVQISGYYFVDANVRHSTTGTATVNQYSLSYIQIDGSTVRQGFNYVQDTSVVLWSTHPSYFGYLNAGQRIRLQHETNITNPNIGTSATDTYMHISRQ